MSDVTLSLSRQELVLSLKESSCLLILDIPPMTLCFN
jgi:hypothetical protein